MTVPEYLTSFDSKSIRNAGDRLNLNPLDFPGLVICGRVKSVAASRLIAEIKNIFGKTDFTKNSRGLRCKTKLWLQW